MSVLQMTDPQEQDLVDMARLEAGRLTGSGSAAAEPASGPRPAHGPGPGPGPEIPGYDLVSEIGDGGQGIVYEARQRSTGRRVAIKVMRGGPAAGTERRHRFEREIRVLGRLRHPSIVATHDSGESDGCFYSVMDLVEGVPIDRHVLEGALDVGETMDLFARVCDAVHAAHQRGVIHRDLKPANILVDHAGDPRVLDFGLAKLVPLAGEEATTVTVAGRVLGTMAWASPEQAQGRGDDVDVRSDVYSLGVVLYELLTGRLPYETSGSVGEALTAIAEAPPMPPSRIDRSLRGDVETIVLTCLAKDRDRRYESVAALAADVRRQMRGDAIDAKRDSRVYLLRKTMRRYRVPISIAGLSLAAGLGFGIVMAALYQDADEARRLAASEVQELREELQRLKAQLVAPASWRTTFASAEQLRGLDPDEGEQLIRQAWAEASEDPAARQQMLKAVSVAGHPRFVRLMDLGMRDPSNDVKQWAIDYLRDATLRDFALDFEAYEPWFERHQDQPLAQLHAAAARELTAAIRAADDPETLFETDGVGRRLENADRVAQAGMAFGLHELLLEVLLETERERTRSTVISALRSMDLDEAFVRDRLLPQLESDRDDVASAIVRILRFHGTPDAIDPLLDRLTRLVEASDTSTIFDTAAALGEIGDPRPIPTMIALIEHDDTYDTVYGIGYFGLASMTGVEYDEAHDGAWWRAWWERSRERFPSAAAIDIPALDLAEAADDPGIAPAGEPAPEQSLLAGGDPWKRYFLFGPRTPAPPSAPEDTPAPRRPRPLLLVMPGGDGSADFKPFVENIWREAAPDDMLVAQLVAPRWSRDQFDTVVWPIKGLPWEGARFTTEAFVTAVVDDVSARYDVDRDRVWILAWSSGGPAAYASLVDGPVTGVFVAMSVFRPEQMADLSHAAGKRVHILHSREDFIAMDFPERARDELREAGAVTKLETYSGGHGWHGDIFAMIRDGLEWLGEGGGEGDGEGSPAADSGG